MRHRPDTTTLARRRNLLAVVVSLTIASLIHGLTLPLLSLVLHRAGVDDARIGLNTAAQFLSIFAVAPAMPSLLRSAGPVRLMFWSVLASAALFLCLRAFVDFHAWLLLRFLLGIAMSFLWISGEALINHVAEEHERGRIISIYVMVAGAGFALGPLVLAGVGTVGWLPFAVAAAVMVIAALPLARVVEGAPKLEGRLSARLPAYLLLAPTSMLMYLGFSASDGILLAFLPLYGMQAGVAEGLAVSLITAMALGTIVFQPGIGWLADRIDRAVLASASLAVLIATTVAMPLVIASTPWNLLLMLILGGGLGGIYTVSMVLLGERFKGADLGAASTVFSVMFCLGAMVGPPAGGMAMELVGANGMPLTLAAICLLLLPLSTVTALRRQRGLRGASGGQR